ncbi:TPA: NusG domain II-containing protein, partial [Enterococcus faecalis]
MHSFRKMLKPWDIILIILISISSFSPVVIAAWKASVKSDSNKMTEVIAVVKINGKIVDEFNLTTTKKSFEKTYYPAKGKYNIIEVAPGKIRVKEDNSPDQVAVRTSWISRPGDT